MSYETGVMILLVCIAAAGLAAGRIMAWLHDRGEGGE